MDKDTIETRYGFSKAVSNGVDTADFDLVVAGTGQTINQTGGNLVITSGTNANSETIIRSKLNFNGDFILRYAALLSQRIVNNNFFVELVDKVAENVSFTMTNATTLVATFPTGHGLTAANIGQSMYLGNFTGLAACIPGRYAISAVSGDTVTFTVAGFPSSGSGTFYAFGWNYHHILYDGTVPTTTKFDSQRNGYSTGDSAVSINTTASPGHVGTLASINATVGFLDQISASAFVNELVQRGSRVQNLPDNNTKLYLQIRAVNGSTAPASTTTFTMNFASITRHDATSVTIAGIFPASQNFVLPIATPSGINPGTNPSSLGKAEDAAAASGDTGVGVLGVRVPAATPAAQTSAAGDYGNMAVDQEGKTVMTPFAGDELAWQGNPITLTSTTSTAVKAAAAAGVRNFITDVTLANTSATGVRVDLLDGATVIRSFWVPATTTISASFSKALKGTAATAVNFQLSAAVTDVRCSANGYLGV